MAVTGCVQSGQGPWQLVWARDAALLAAVGACLWVSSRASLSSRLWMDDLITVTLAEDSSLSHALDAVWRGLDATPPFYVVLGWIMHGLLPGGTDVATALRIANAALLASTFLLLDRIARVFLQPTLALVCVCIFILLQRDYIRFLLVEVRTYALFFALATLCLHRFLKAVAPGSDGSDAVTALCLFALTASHTFGIVYAGILAFAAALTFAADRRWSELKSVAACLAPSLLAIVLWLPVLRHQAEIPSWISSPGPRAFIGALHPPQDRALAAALAAAVGLALLSLARPGVANMATRKRHSIVGVDPRAMLLLILPLPTALTMSVIWLESRLGFPIFLDRYFGFNVLLTFLAVLACAAAACRMKPILVVCERPIAGIAMAALCAGLLLTPSPPDGRIACVDPATGIFVEDRSGSNLPVLAPFSVNWLPRMRVPGKTTMFPVDSNTTIEIHKVPLYENSKNFVRVFENWAGTNSMRTDAQLLNLPNGFLVVDDGAAPWVSHAANGVDFRLTPLLQTSTCHIWRAMPVQVRPR